MKMRGQCYGIIPTVGGSYILAESEFSDDAQQIEVSEFRKLQRGGGLQFLCLTFTPVEGMFCVHKDGEFQKETQKKLTLATVWRSHSPKHKGNYIMIMTEAEMKAAARYMQLDDYTHYPLGVNSTAAMSIKPWHEKWNICKC